MSLFHREKKPSIPYDRETQRPAVRRSICTGEMTVGFLDKNTGRFREYECVHTERELEAFFLSVWFRLACGLNGAHVLRILREEVLRRDRS